MLIPNGTYYEIYGDQNELSSTEQLKLSYGEVREIGIMAVISAMFDNLGIKNI